jgi:hypothetical protein
LNQLLELPLPSTLPRIALIKQEHQPECTHINSILKAQSDGAVGVIMYGSQIDPSRDDDNIKVSTATYISTWIEWKEGGKERERERERESKINRRD